MHIDLHKTVGEQTDFSNMELSTAAKPTIKPERLFMRSSKLPRLVALILSLYSTCLADFAVPRGCPR